MIEVKTRGGDPTVVLKADDADNAYDENDLESHKKPNRGRPGGNGPCSGTGAGDATPIACPLCTHDIRITGPVDTKGAV